ncbi:MAG TPA: TlpA disulfide reductase family protein [Polyangia bacterium]|nr:TlpA disulfide reductase family protein [Polyangia bacterium]
MSGSAVPALLALATVGATLAGSPRGGLAAEPAPAAKASAAPGGESSVVLVDLKAIKQAMQQSHGRTLLVHFWASWCLPCMEELPLINRFAQKAKGQGVDVLSVSLDNPDAAARVAKVLSRSAPNLTRTIAKIDDADAFIATFDRQWEGAIPALFGFDGEGKLRGHRIGEATRRQLDGLVGEVIGKPFSTAAAVSGAPKK